MRRIAALLLTFLAAPAWGQLSLSDLVIPSNHTLIFGALLSAGSPSGEDRWRPPNGSIVDGTMTITDDNPATDDLTINRIWSRAGPRIQFSRSGGQFANFFEIGSITGQYVNAATTFYFQNATTGAEMVLQDFSSFDLTSTPPDGNSGDIGGGFMNFRSSQIVNIVDPLTAGDLFIVAASYPTPAGPPTTAQHAEFGTTDVETAYFGTTEGLRVYYGGTLVFGAAP